MRQIELLPEIRPENASPEIMALYDRIRSAGGFPQVNLVYRHLATYPGMLAWVWHVLEPHYASGWLERAGQRLLTRIVPYYPEPVWDSCPVDVAEALSGVLSSYNRANAQNLIGLSALYEALRAGVRPRTTTAPERARAPVEPIVPLPALADLSTDVRALVRSMAARHPEHTMGVVPSMYLHLALWPDALQLAHERLGRFVDQSKWTDDKRAILESAAVEGEGLAKILDTEAPMPDTARQDPPRRALRHFLNGTIPDMLMVGVHLCGARGRASIVRPAP